MLVNESNYDDRGNDNFGIVVRCPTLVGNRLVYFNHNRKTQGWVIRDFIVGQKLDKETSRLSVKDIEADVDYDEFPPWLNVSREAEWRDYLRARTNAVLRLHNDPLSTVLPNGQSGKWRDLP